MDDNKNNASENKTKKKANVKKRAGKNPRVSATKGEKK